MHPSASLFHRNQQNDRFTMGQGLMSEKIEFTRNYSDLRTNQGFQFEFKCDRCGTGYRTRFRGSALGTTATALNTAGNIFGGLFNHKS